MPKPSALSVEEEERLSNVYKNPKNSVIDIAADFGVSRSTVYSILERTNTPLRAPQKRQKRDSPRHQIKMTNMKRAVELRAEKWTYEAIAAELNVRTQTVYNYIRQARQTTQREAVNGRPQ